MYIPDYKSIIMSARVYFPVIWKGEFIGSPVLDNITFDLKCLVLPSMDKHYHGNK